MMYEDYLMHVGNKNSGRYPRGSGDRPYQHDGRIIKKGTKVYRLADSKDDPVYDRKKYVSLTKEDHEKWQKYIGDTYADRGKHTYNVMYETTQDLKIAPYTKIGEMFTESYLQNSHQKMLDDTIYSSRSLGYKSDNLDDMLSLNFAMQTETGKKFVDELLKQGYQGIEDRHGRNTADDPIIIFNPEENFKKKRVTLYK